MTVHGIDRRTFVKTVGVGALVASSGVASAAKPPATRFKTHLTGDEEVPTPVDTKAQGQANFKLEKDGTVSYKLNVTNIKDVIGVHIHQAPAGVNGPIVVPLLGGPFIATPVNPNGSFLRGVITDGDLSGPLTGESIDDLLDAMRDGDTYVNVHTDANPGGEIRGQIS